MNPRESTANFIMHREEWTACVAIQQIVAEHYGCRLTDMAGTRRARVVAVPRMVAMYLCRKLTPASFTTLGYIFGKDHTTIMSGIKRITAMMEKSGPFKDDVEMLMTQLGGANRI